MKKCIHDVELPDVPMIVKGKIEDNVNGAKFDD